MPTGPPDYIHNHEDASQESNVLLIDAGPHLHALVEIQPGPLRGGNLDRTRHRVAASDS